MVAAVFFEVGSGPDQCSGERQAGLSGCRPKGAARCAGPCHGIGAAVVAGPGSEECGFVSSDSDIAKPAGDVLYRSGELVGRCVSIALSIGDAPIARFERDEAAALRPPIGRPPFRQISALARTVHTDYVGNPR